MKKEIADQWVAALRRGEYEQGRGQLKNVYGKFCALGVLCDVVAPNNWKQMRDGRYACEMDEIDSHSTLLPTSVLVMTGMHSRSETNLAGLNDVAGRSFDEIADYIEQHWEQL